MELMFIQRINKLITNNNFHNFHTFRIYQNYIY